MEPVQDWSGRKYRAEFDGEDEKEEYSGYDDDSTTDDEEDKSSEKKESQEETMTEEKLVYQTRTEPVKWCVCVNDGPRRNRKRRPQSKYEERHDLLDEYFSDDDFPRHRRSCCCRYCICCRWWCLLSMMLVSLGALLAVLWWGEDTLQAGVYRALVMSEGSSRDYMWKMGQLDAFYTVRVFNLTNPKQFMNGERPRMHELGPYVYSLKEMKENVVYKEDGRVIEYQGRPTYVFQPHLSAGSEEDVVTTVNIPFVNAADMVKDNSAVKTVLKMIKKMYGFDTLRTLRVSELLWGHKSRVLDWARTVQEVPYPYQQFGVLMGLNDTLQRPYRMHTGKGDPRKMNKILAWNNHETLDFWYGDTCNMIRGTDANGFGPEVSKNDTLFIFNGRLCRSLPLVYDSTVTQSGLQAYRFVHPDGVFAYKGPYTENWCYCGPKGCPPRGVLDMKPCLFGASVGFSFPHFYKGDPKLRHMVLGLRPDPAKHRTEFDIYPDLGVPLRVKLRMQMNVMLDGNQALERARHFDVVLPVFWFEVGVDSLPGEVVGLLKLAQNLPPVVKTTSVTLCTALTLIFLLLLLAQTIATWCGWGSSRIKRPLTPEDLPHHAHYRPAPQPWHYDELRKPPKCGDSFTSILKDSPSPVHTTSGLDIPIIDDHTLLPPYRRRNNYDVPDTLPRPDDGEYNVDPDQVPPPYSPGPPQRSASTVSVEIHTTASDDDLAQLPLDTVPVKRMPLEQQAHEYHPTPQDLPMVVETQDPERVGPSTSPPVPGEAVVAPLEEASDKDGKPARSSSLPSPVAPEPQLPRVSPPLATSSPQGSTAGSNKSRSELPPPLESDL